MNLRTFLSSLPIVLGLAACSGGGTSGVAPDNAMGGASTGGTSSTGGAGGEPAEVTCDDRAVETLTFDQVFWSGGFKVSLGEARFVAATPDCPNGALVIDAQFYNRGSEAELDERVLLTSNGNDYSADLSDVPDVPSQRTGKGSIGFLVDADFSLSDATLLAGGAGENQAIVPLGESSAEQLVSLEPTDITVPEQFESDYLTFKVTEAYVRADSPIFHTNLEEKTWQVALTFDITNKHEGSANLSQYEFALELPDGTSVGTDPLGSFGAELLWGGETMKDATVLFEVSGPLEGKYKLTGSASNTFDVEGVLEFEVPKLAAFGS